MTDVLTRVLQLIERAGRIKPGSGDGLEDEARTAGHIACALIREHKLVVSKPEDPTQHPSVERSADKIWEEVMRRSGLGDEFFGPRRPRPQPQPPRPPNPRRPAHATNKEFGVWEVDCEGGCGRGAGKRSTPWASAEAAKDAGYRVIEGTTLCPSCVKQHTK